MQKYKIVFKPLPSYIYVFDDCETKEEAVATAFNCFFEDVIPEVDHVKEI